MLAVMVQGCPNRFVTHVCAVFYLAAVANTYYARIHLARVNSQGQVEPETEVEVDARPSDAINLAVRFGAPMYVNRKIAESACASPPEAHALHSSNPGTGGGILASTGETHADIARSVRETLASFEDPTSECAPADALCIAKMTKNEHTGLAKGILACPASGLENCIRY